MKKRFIIGLMFLFYSFVAIAADETIVKLSQKDSFEMRMKLTQLDGYKENIEKSLQNSFNEYKNTNERQQTPIYILFAVIGVLAAVGLIGYILRIKKTIEDSVNNKISNIVDESKDKIVSIVQNYELESLLKKEKHILLLSKNQEHSNSLSSLFNKFDFSQKHNLVYSNLDSIRGDEKFKKSSIVIINDINSDKFNQSDLDALLSAFTKYDVCFVYFGLFNAALTKYKNLNFANSEFTLYSRILESLKIQKVLS